MECRTASTVLDEGSTHGVNPEEAELSGEGETGSW